MIKLNNYSLYFNPLMVGRNSYVKKYEIVNTGVLVFFLIYFFFFNNLVYGELDRQTKSKEIELLSEIL